MKCWPVIRHIRYAYHVLFKFDPDSWPDPTKLTMELEYLAGLKEGAW